MAENKPRLRAWNWADLDPRERDYWSIPSKDVFQFAFHLNERGHRKVYDLGCGIGRNLFFLIDMGFDLYGSDYSPDAVNEVNKYLGEINYPHRVKLESMTEISEQDEFYDAVIAYNVVYHSYLADMMKALKNVYRILRPGGSLLITFQSKRSPECREQREIEPGTVIKTHGHEAGVPHHFVDQEEILNALSGYRMTELSHVEHEFDGLKHRGCHFVVTATKQRTRSDCARKASYIIALCANASRSYPERTKRILSRGQRHTDSGGVTACGSLSTDQDDILRACEGVTSVYRCLR